MKFYLIAAGIYVALVWLFVILWSRFPRNDNHDN